MNNYCEWCGDECTPDKFCSDYCLNEFMKEATEREFLQ